MSALRVGGEPDGSALRIQLTKLACRGRCLLSGVMHASERKRTFERAVCV